MTDRLTSPITRRNAIHELDHRSNNGIDVRLLWNSRTNQLSIAVADGRAGESFAFEVAPVDSVDAFHHPHAYAPQAQRAAPPPAQERPPTPAANAATASPLRRLIDRVRAAWRAIDYEQGRLLEIRTGVPMLQRQLR